MSGRHESSEAVRRWAPTAFNAVLACVPFSATATALGLAGGGYLLGQEGVAASGAVVGAFGMSVQRWQSRAARRRMRRERTDLRGQIQGLQVSVEQLTTQLDAVMTMLQHSAAATAPSGTAPSVPAPIVAVPPAMLMPLPPLLTPLSLADPPPLARTLSTGAIAGLPAPVFGLTDTSTMQIFPAAARSEVSLFEKPLFEKPLFAAPTGRAAAVIPGQAPSPFATGGIPLLEPGPAVSLTSVVDLRDSVTQPDDEGLTLVLVGSSAGIHTGDAHHAGNWSREGASREATSSGRLVVVKRGKHVA